MLLQSLIDWAGGGASQGTKISRTKINDVPLPIPWGETDVASRFLCSLGCGWWLVLIWYETKVLLAGKWYWFNMREKYYWLIGWQAKWMASNGVTHACKDLHQCISARQGHWPAGRTPIFLQVFVWYSWRILMEFSYGCPLPSKLPPNKKSCISYWMLIFLRKSSSSTRINYTTYLIYLKHKYISTRIFIVHFKL